MKLVNHQLPALWVGAFLTITGCGQQFGSQVEQITIQEKLLPHPNPTNHEFDASVSELTNAIKKAYGDDWYLAEAKKNHDRVWRGDGDANTKRLFTLTLQQPPESLFFKGDADALAKHLL